MLLVGPTLPVILTNILFSSPNKVLRSLHALNAKEIIALTVLLVGKIPEDLYAELVDHAK
jgi:cell cycle arrest protein BUB2